MSKEIIALFLNLENTSGHSSTQLDRFGGNRHREKSETNSKSEPRLRWQASSDSIIVFRFDCLIRIRLFEVRSCRSFAEANTQFLVYIMGQE